MKFFTSAGSSNFLILLLGEKFCVIRKNLLGHKVDSKGSRTFSWESISYSVMAHFMQIDFLARISDFLQISFLFHLFGVQVVLPPEKSHVLHSRIQ